MKHVFSTKIIILLTLVIFSCTPKNQEPQVRLVGLDGKPGKKVDPKVPDLNIEALRQQGRLAKAEQFTQNLANNQNNFGQYSSYQNQYSNQTQPQNYASASSKIIEDTLQFSQNPQFNEQPKFKNQQVIYQKDKRKSVPEYNLANIDEEIEIEVIDKTKPNARPSQQVSKKKKYVKTPAKKKSAGRRSSGKKYYAQVGSFLNKNNANKELKRMKKFHSGKIQTVRGKKVVHRVILGPFTKKSSARNLVSKVKKSGHDAILIKTQ